MPAFAADVAALGLGAALFAGRAGAEARGRDVAGPRRSRRSSRCTCRRRLRRCSSGPRRRRRRRRVRRAALFAVRAGALTGRRVMAALRGAAARADAGAGHAVDVAGRRGAPAAPRPPCSTLRWRGRGSSRASSGGRPSRRRRWSRCRCLRGRRRRRSAGRPAGAAAPDAVVADRGEGHAVVTDVDRPAADRDGRGDLVRVRRRAAAAGLLDAGRLGALHAPSS